MPNLLCVLLFFKYIPSVFSKIPVLWNGPVEETSFLSRNDYLIDIKVKLIKGPVTITGVSGVGKSHLTFAYARKNASSYHIVWVFDVSKGVAEQMINFANKLYTMTHRGKRDPFLRKRKRLTTPKLFCALQLFHGSLSLIMPLVLRK